MRHFLSVLLALVLAPIVYICDGFSAVWFTEATASGDTDVAKTMLGLVAALLAGGLYAVLVMARLSPPGPVLAGLIYLGISGWAIVNPDGFDRTIPATLLGVSNVLHAAVPFGTSLLAAPLLVTIFSPRRWRRSARPAAPGYEAGPVYPPTPGSAAPTCSTLAGAASADAPTLTDQPSVVAPGYRAPSSSDASSFTPLRQPPTYSDSSTTFSGFTPASSANATSTDDDPNRSRY